MYQKQHIQTAEELQLPVATPILQQYPDKMQGQQILYLGPGP